MKKTSLALFLAAAFHSIFIPNITKSVVLAVEESIQDFAALKPMHVLKAANNSNSLINYQPEQIEEAYKLINFIYDNQGAIFNKITHHSGTGYLERIRYVRSKAHKNPRILFNNGEWLKDENMMKCFIVTLRFSESPQNFAEDFLTANSSRVTAKMKKELYSYNVDTVRNALGKLTVNESNYLNISKNYHDRKQKDDGPFFRNGKQLLLEAIYKNNNLYAIKDIIAKEHNLHLGKSNNNLSESHIKIKQLEQQNQTLQAQMAQQQQEQQSEIDYYKQKQQEQHNQHKKSGEQILNTTNPIEYLNDEEKQMMKNFYENQ
jgi:hypothetical protein